jgi:hypothetical protein
MNYKDQQHTKHTNKWLKRHGVNVKHIFVGTVELFQASKQVTMALTNCAHLLQRNQAKKLNKFLQAAGNGKLRQSITQAQCYQVMNTAKQAQRLAAKQLKAKR